MFLEIDGLRINVDRAGAGDPVVLLHGWGASARSLAPVVQTLCRSYSVTALDFPGFGLSQQPSAPWGVYEFAQFVRHAMARLEIKRTHLLGHSHGGRVSIMLAAQSPELVDKLILVDSAGIRPPRTLRLRARGLTARTGRRILSHRLAGGPGRRALTALYGRLGMADYRDSGPMRPTFIKVVNEDLGSLLPSIQAPTLVVWGAEDEETPVWMGERMAREIPRARLLVLERAAHFPYLDEREAFDRALTQFLAEEVR
ncbi:MAG: alpha/beta fold hydrolase [Dehalococcoidia bacterium]